MRAIHPNYESRDTLFIVDDTTRWMIPDDGLPVHQNEPPPSIHELAQIKSVHVALDEGPIPAFIWSLPAVEELAIEIKLVSEVPWAGIQDRLRVLRLMGAGSFVLPPGVELPLLQSLYASFCEPEILLGLAPNLIALECTFQSEAKLRATLRGRRLASLAVRCSVWAALFDELSLDSVLELVLVQGGIESLEALRRALELRTLVFRQQDRLSSFAPLESCEKLESVAFYHCRPLPDPAPLIRLPMLNRVYAYSSGPRATCLDPANKPQSLQVEWSE